MVAVTLAIIGGVVESEEGSALWALISCVRHLNGGGMTAPGKRVLSSAPR